jgi:hypothetical protein
VAHGFAAQKPHPETLHLKVAGTRDIQHFTGIGLWAGTGLGILLPIHTVKLHFPQLGIFPIFLGGSARNQWLRVKPSSRRYPLLSIWAMASGHKPLAQPPDEFTLLTMWLRLVSILNNNNSEISMWNYAEIKERMDSPPIGTDLKISEYKALDSMMAVLVQSRHKKWN